MIFVGLSAAIRTTAGSDGWINWDAPIFLDGAWRVLQGQRPHVDFSTPVGPVTLGAGALGMAIAGPSIRGMHTGVAIVFAALTLCAFALARATVSRVTAVLFAVLVGSYLITPRVLGYPSVSRAFTGYYNLVGYAVLAMVMLDVLSGRPRSVAPRQERWRGAVVGSLTIVLLFVKVPLFIAAGGVVVYGMLGGKLTRAYLVGAAVGSAVSLVAFLAYLDFDLAAIVRDLSIVAASRLQEGATSPSALLIIAGQCALTIGAMGLLQALALPTEPDARWYVLGRLGLSIGIGILICASIMQPPEFAIAGPFAVVVASEYFAAGRRPPDASISTRSLGVLAVCGVLVVWPLSRNLVSLVRAQVRHAGVALGVLTALPDRRPVVDESQPGAEGCCSQDAMWPSPYREGLSLLRRFVVPSDRIVSVGDNNLFSFALQQQSPRNDLLFWHAGVTFSPSVAATFPLFDPDRVLADVTVIALSETSKPETVIAFRAIYDGYLSRHFYEFARTSDWIILRRRPV